MKVLAQFLKLEQMGKTQYNNNKGSDNLCLKMQYNVLKKNEWWIHERGPPKS